MSQNQYQALNDLKNEADAIAEANDAGVQAWFDEDNQNWVLSIEPVGDKQGEWVVRGDGVTEEEAYTDLIDNARAIRIAD